MVSCLRSGDEDDRLGSFLVPLPQVDCAAARNAKTVKKAMIAIRSFAYTPRLLSGNELLHNREWPAQTKGT